MGFFFLACISTAATERLERLSLIQQFPADQMKEDFLILWQRTSVTKSLSEAAANMSLLNWLPKKRRKKKPHNYIQLLPEWSHFASREQLFGNKAPQRQTGPWAQGDEVGTGWMLFQIAFPQKYFSTYHLVFCINSRDAAESWTRNKLSRLKYIFFFFIFHVGFLFSCSVSFEMIAKGRLLFFLPRCQTKFEYILV